jgi:phage tail-like protein
MSDRELEPLLGTATSGSSSAGARSASPRSGASPRPPISRSRRNSRATDSTRSSSGARSPRRPSCTSGAGPSRPARTTAEYRNGNEKENSVRKITGLNRAADVTLKRGIIGSLSLYQWLDQIRNGDQGALRTVVIQLLSEDHTQVVQTWKLLRARIVKHVSGPFNAKANDVAMEELTLAYERLELE